MDNNALLSEVLVFVLLLFSFVLGPHPPYSALRNYSGDALGDHVGWGLNQH